MAKKQIFTNAEIEEDIMTAMKYPPEETKSSFKRATLPFILIVILLVVIEIFYPIFILLVLLGLIVFSICYIIFRNIRLKKQIKSVTINNYTITTEAVNSTSEEHFRVKNGKYSSKQIDNYTIRFENEKTWRIPKENHLWSERYRMSDHAVFASTHRGDVMIVITKNANGEIVMAYNTEFFEYRSLRSI